MPFSDSDCLFIHIPKCAGTSVEVALRVADEYPAIGLEPTSTRPHLSRLFGAGLQHLTVKEIRRNFPDVLARNRFSFSIVRDPVDRFISHFLWANHRFSDVYLDDSSVLEAFLRATDDLLELSRSMDAFQEPFEGFEYCQGNAQSFPCNDIRRHLLPQCSYLFDRGIVPLDAIYPINKLDALEHELRRRGAIVQPIPRRIAGKTVAQLRRAIPESAEQAIQEVYASDMRLNELVGDVAPNVPEGSCPGMKIDAGALTSSRAIAMAGAPGFSQKKPRVPRRLWMYWHQGWDEAPTIVRKCAESWLLRNPSWHARLLSAQNLASVIKLPSYASESNLPLPALSDVIRIHLLARHGGVWADATTWCARPMEEWIDFVTTSGFFAYARPALDRKLSSWFLAALPGHYIVKRWKQACDWF